MVLVVAGSTKDSTITGVRATAEAPGSASRQLALVHPPELRRTFPLIETECILGRDPGPAGLRLHHPTVSRCHAAIAWEQRRRAHVLRDLESHNGTRVDGLSAAEAPRLLVDQSLARVGDVLLVYQIVPSRSEDADQELREALPGDAPAMQALRAEIARAARDPAPVLILGETGSGKEYVARELHRASARQGPLLALNCAALSPQLVESQLFGHVKGAFTGAADAHPGLFRAAHGGTLVLDEIGELAPELQPKLLRALQEGEVLPIGGIQPLRVDVRVIAATHRDLARAVDEGRFRQDLYARLALWELHVPALRERRGDLLDWVDRMYAAWVRERLRASIRTGQALGPPPADRLRFDADAIEVLLRSAWPLNLRGIERLVHAVGSAASTGQTLGVAALPAWLSAPPAIAADEQANPEVVNARRPVPSREEFVRAYDELGGNVRALARRFGRDRRQVYRWIAAHVTGQRGC